MSCELPLAKMVNVPAAIAHASTLGLPDRAALRAQGSTHSMGGTQFRADPRGPSWDSPYYDGLRLLLKKFPPPIRLPGSVSVARADRLPEQDPLLEGKRWTLTWTESGAEVFAANRSFPVRCTFTVYHKYDKVRQEANWRIYAIIRPNERVLSEGDSRILADLRSVTLRLRTPQGEASKESVLTVGPNPKKNNLARPSGDDRGGTHDTYSYVILSAHEFEWVSTDRESFARSKRGAHSDASDLLEREHFKTQPTSYRWTPESSAVSFVQELCQSALIGIPRATLMAPRTTEGLTFFMKTGEVAAAQPFSSKIKLSPGELRGDNQLFKIELPAFADSLTQD